MTRLNRTFIVLSLTSFIALPVFAETAGQTAKDTVNTVKRETKKAGHRIEEELCTGTKAECTMKKVKNRVEETKDEVQDKLTE